MSTRVRFAPSPTGFFHIGSARTALFNWLYARHTGGTFVLRIEDTDKERNTDEALRFLLEGMRWLGIDWDEGPEQGGDFGPYFQSQRGDIYQRYLEKLKEAGRTYEKDGAWWFRLEGERETVYDDYKKAEVEKVTAPPVVVDDAIRGRVEKTVETDFVLVRANGDPSFHFVNVVDDIEMKITHVIRGEDHLSNTPKHVLLYQALGVPVPVFAHIPLILKTSGPGKMSKRDEGALIEDYEKNGFLPQAVRNYLCLLGWNPKDDREVMPINNIIELFDFPGINKGNARFDHKKLTAINTAYLRELPVETLAWYLKPRLIEAGVIAEDAELSEDYFQAVLTLTQAKLSGLDTVADYLGYFFKDEFAYDEKPLKKQTKGGWQDKRAAIVAALEPVEPWTAESIGAAYEQLAEANSEKPFAYFPLTRLAVSGKGGGPDMLPMLELLGKERVLARLRGFSG